jgi:hypothetical protein
MSSTASPFTSSDDRQTLTPGQVFKELIWHHPTICRQCFERVAVDDVLDGHDKISKDPCGERTVIVEEHPTQTDSPGVPDMDVETCGEYGAVYRVEGRRTCPGCGDVGMQNRDDALSKREATRRVEAIHARLEEQGVDADLELMKRTVCRGKQKEKLANRDRAIFAKATQLGVRRALR